MVLAHWIRCLTVPNGLKAVAAAWNRPGVPSGSWRGSRRPLPRRLSGKTGGMRNIIRISFAAPGGGSGASEVHLAEKQVWWILRLKVDVIYCILVVWYTNHRGGNSHSCFILLCFAPYVPLCLWLLSFTSWPSVILFENLSQRDCLFWSF